MIRKFNPVTSEKLSDLVVKGMQEKKASNIIVMDLRKVQNAVADFFVVCSGNSDRQVEAISESVEENVNVKADENPWHIEGKNNMEWVLLDYINVVAHIFQSEKRDYYSLENLWGDAVAVEVEAQA